MASLHSGFKHIGVILKTKLLFSSAAAFSLITSKLSSLIYLVRQSTILFWHLLCFSIKIKFLSKHCHSVLTNFPYCQIQLAFLLILLLFDLSKPLIQLLILLNSVLPWFLGHFDCITP